MEVYVARQPIFDRTMQVYGYELLYRRSQNNFYEGVDDDQATAELINNAYLVMSFAELTSGTRAFINFSKELLEKEIPLLLPKKTVVVEILERVEPTESVVAACKKLKDNGFTLALDDFIFHKDYLPLIELADIIKVEFPAVSHGDQRRLIEQYKGRIKFLAEKIETREEYQVASKLGYDYFQGYFFSMPMIVSRKQIEGLNVNLVRIISELDDEDPQYDRIADIIKSDLGLSYKLLKMANSVEYGALYEIYSIKQALVRLGGKEVKKWIYLMMLSDKQRVENRELIKSSMVRGKMMELMAEEMGRRSEALDFFMTGMFSLIDVILNRDMKEILAELPFPSEVKAALLGKNNLYYQTLDQVVSYEMADWSKMESLDFFGSIERQRFLLLYMQALRWSLELEY